MPHFVLSTTLESRKIPFGAVPGGFRVSIVNRETGQPVREPVEYPNANVAIPDLDEGKYRLALVRLDANTRAPISAPVEVDYDVVAPVAELPVSFSVVPA